MGAPETLPVSVVTIQCSYRDPDGEPRRIVHLAGPASGPLGGTGPCLCGFDRHAPGVGFNVGGGTSGIGLFEACARCAELVDGPIRGMNADDFGWVDRHCDIWRFGDDGLMHTPETAPFSRAHVEKKWGPLQLIRVTRLHAAPEPEPRPHPAPESLVFEVSRTVVVTETLRIRAESEADAIARAARITDEDWHGGGAMATASKPGPWSAVAVD